MLSPEGAREGAKTTRFSTRKRQARGATTAVDHAQTAPCRQSEDTPELNNLRSSASERKHLSAHSSSSSSSKFQPTAPKNEELAAVAHLIRTAKRIVILTGAGISVSCGVPDFRSEGGLYDMIGKFCLGLPQPECLFDIEYFQDDPAPFYEFAAKLFPSNLKREEAKANEDTSNEFASEFNPSRTHHFIRMLEMKRKLLRNYTQNVDGIEFKAGLSSNKVVQCHGNFSKGRCLKCKRKYKYKEFRSHLLSGRVQYCDKKNRKWTCGGIVKPDITFFGEKVSPKVFELLQRDREKVDLIIVIGTSLSVEPVSEILNVIPPRVPQVLINREPVRPKKASPDWKGFDYELLGDCDDVTTCILKALRWSN